MTVPYTPSESEMRERATIPVTHWTDEEVERAPGEWDRFIARVRKDAIDDFIKACTEKRDQPGYLLPVNYFDDINAAIRVAESYAKENQ